MTYQTAPSDNPRTREIAARTIGWGDLAASAEIALDAERNGGGNPASVRAAGAAGRGLVVWDVKEGEGPSLFAKEWLAEELAGDTPPLTVGGPILPLADVAISGMVTLNGAGIENVLLSGFSGLTRTNSLGVYTALVPIGWSGTVTPSMPGFTFAPAGHTYTNVILDMPGENYVMTFVGGVDDIYEDNDSLSTAAVVPQGMTTNLVLRDEDWFRFDVTAEDAGKDLQVRVWGTAFPDTTSSRDLDFGIINSSGRLMSYSLSSNSDETAVVCDVAQGSYYIVQDYVGLEGTVYSLSVLLSDDFGLGYISGYVTDEWESPIEGATVELYGVPFDWHLTRPLVTTDSNGFYKIAWAPGDYTVQFNQTDFNDTLTGRLTLIISAKCSTTARS